MSDRLTREEEAFAQGLAYGFTPSMAAENAGLELSQIEAKHLSLRQDIAERVTGLVTTQLWDLGNEHIRIAAQLEIDRDFAYRMGNPAAAINATIQRAKVLGVYIERVDTSAKVAVSSPEQLTPEEWAKRFGAEGEVHARRPAQPGLQRGSSADTEGEEDDE